MIEVLFGEEDITIMQQGQVELRIPMNEASLHASYVLGALHLLKNLYNNEISNTCVVVDEDGLTIYENEQKENEIVMWHVDEFLEDTDAFMAAVNALCIACRDGLRTLRMKLGN